MAGARARLLEHLWKVKKSEKKTGCATRDRQEGESLRVAFRFLKDET